MGGVPRFHVNLVNAGFHYKYDDFVTFSNEHKQKRSNTMWGRFTSFLGSHSKPESSTRLQPIEEFLLVLLCYMPNWNGFMCIKPKESEATSENTINAFRAITDVVYVVRSLQSISFSDGHQWNRKYDFDNHERLKIFNDIFRAKISENIACLPAGNSSFEIFQCLISGISMAHLLKKFIPENLPYDARGAAVPLISCISLRFSYLAGITRPHLESLLINEFGPKLLREIGDSLFSLISQFTNMHWIRKAIKTFCSVLSLIKIIYSCTDQHSPDLTEITDKIKQGISHSKCTTDELCELEATVYFERDLEKFVFDIIGVGNFDQIASNKVFHLTSILQEVYFYINSKNCVTEVEALTNVVAQLTIRCKNGGFEMQKDERFLEGIFALFNLLTSKLKRIQLQSHMDFYRSLVGLTEQLFTTISSCCISVKENRNQLKVRIARGMKNVLEYFTAEKYLPKLDTKLQFLDMLLKMKIAVEEIKDYLDGEVVNATNRLLTENLKDYETVLHIICAADTKTTSAKMMKIYEDVANNIVESNLSGSDQDTVFRFMHKSSRFQKMLWVMATKQFGTAKTPIDQLKKLLDWPPSQGMIKLSVVSKEDIESQKKFSGVLDVFINVQNKLIDGTITVEELNVVRQKFSKFFSISNTLCGTRNIQKVSGNHLKSRWEEYMYFTEWKSKVERLIRLCEQPRGLTVEMSNLKEDLTIDLNQMQLCRLCCRQKDKLKVTLTSLPDDLEAELSNLHVLAESRIFSLMWDASGRAVKNAISLEDVINAIYKPVISKLRDLFKSLFEESITLNEISRVFKDYSTDLQIEELKKDIKLVVDKIFLPQTISQPDVNKLDVDLQPDDQESEESSASDDDSDDWHFIGNDYNPVIDKAAEKITQVFKLQSCQKKADDLIRTGRRLKLKGDFSIFEDIQQKIAFNKDKKFELKSLKKAHFDAVDSLQLITDEMGRCLADVLQCSPLITWLREKLDRLRDVKTFVDLMSISAGESDYEADRISNLHTVCLSYEPIIFDLPVSSGPDDLIKRCSTVLDGIEKDPTLPKKLLDCNRQLEWFKKERESYGSIAKSSMMETEAANRRGYYIVGAIQETDAKRSLENSLSLVVPEEDSNGKSKTGDEDKKTYSIDEIRDLQSKLMLIGGNKGRQRESGQLEKDAFLKMFAAILRIATVYVDLCSAGCSLYLKWKKTFKCNLDDFERAIMSIEEEWHKMEATLHEWRNELHEKRWIHPNLNYYTIRQLMSLQKALHPVLSDHGNLRAVRDLPTQVFTLLEAIYPDISTTVIKDVVLKSEHVRRYESTQNNKDDWKNIESDEGKFSGIPVETVLTFIAELESEDIEENVAKAAAMQCGTNDLPEAIAWAFDNAKENSVIEDLSNRMDKVLSIKENEDESEAGLERLDENDNEEPMSELAEYKFIDEAEFLSLDEIGVFLSELGNHKKLKKGKRKKCEVMSDGRPNVMVVPQDDLLLLLLEVYREAGNCLPKAEEVLICSENTTAEEIELLFRRALRDVSNLYSLAFIDRLNYNVSEQAFKMLERLCGENAAKDNVSKTDNASKTDNVSKKSGYNLLLLCASGKEEVSFLASALHSYRIASPPCLSKFDVKSFLEKQFKVASGHSPKDLHAAHADCDGYSVRVVLSRTPGTGKSLYVKRAGEKLEEQVEGSNSAIAQVTLHLDSFLFNLIVLGSFSASDGSIWRKRRSDLYMIEITQVILSEEKKTGEEEKKRITNIGTIIPLFPMTICQTPKETFSALERNQRPSPGFDVEEFKSQAFQRVYQYLKMLGTDERAIDRFVFSAKEIRGDQADCLRILLQHCGVEDPSWREIQNFVHFFDKQLSDYICYKFMLQMAKDFATPSVDSGTEDRIGLISLRRRWEKSEHPYLFFNQGGITMSFLGFTVNAYGDLMDKFNTKVIFKSVMTRDLYAGLQRQGVELFSQYEKWDRTKQLEVLCQVMGIDVLFDPDETYELTMDNMMKILAIHMRFRCGIPVVIMGETGCGKTHLIRFMCKLKAGPGGPNNMLLVKVHGGVTKEDIMLRVDQAVRLAKENHQKRPDLETVLFFDEANTTDAVGLIKEVTCDQRIGGKKLDLASCGLQVIAACNPYRRHSDSMILKLESAGLGYHVKAEDTLEKLACDINAFFFTKFMREQKNECSFVSLRDVERAVQVMSWFYSKMDTFLPLIIKRKKNFVMRPIQMKTKMWEARQLKVIGEMIIQDNMQGTSSYSDLFKTFKQILMCSYQCSPLSTAEGIIGTFRQCSRFQEGKDLDNFASVVVLDEVGLAEDSPRMPLKALHPLLEDGTDGSEELTLEGSELKAKRGQPDKNELINSAEGICNSDPITKDRIKIRVFGLRDYYSLIKMIFTCAKSKKGLPTLQEIEFAVKRNFGGLEEINVWEVFQQALLPFFPQEQMNTNTEEDSLTNCSCSPVDLLRSSLQKNDLMKDGRYLLLLTENYAALRALEKIFPDVHANANVIFGSSFPKDQEFTQICRDINKIKICMETGMTVILLNMENLYESLYDALNQYYIWLGGQRYVDLGLGTHRVKCRVHDDFKLIVVAEKDTVYKSFPIPLINRLEKHFLVMSTMMNARQLNLADRLNTWALDFSSVTHRRKKYSIGDAFIGFNDDTAAAVILETFHVLGDGADDAQILNRSKERLLESATPEAVTRLTQTSLSSVAGEIWNTYFEKQHHLCLDDFLQHALKSAESSCGISAQVTTFSRLLSPHDQSQLAESLSGICTINCISLSQFQTEQQFCEEIRQYVKNDRMTNSVLIVQCDLGDERANLIACARHLCEEERNSHANETEMALHIIFIINLTRVSGGCKYLGSFHGVNWLSAHIDELRPPNHELPSLINYANCEMSHLFKGNVVKQDEDKYESNGGKEENKSNAPDVECFSRENKMILDDDDDHSINDETIKQNGPDVFARQMLEPDEEMAISDSDENDMHHSLNALTPERDERMVIENPSVDKTNEQNTLDTNMEESPEPEVSFSLQLGLMRRCVQASVAEAINLSSGQDAERTTKRIHLLLDLLSPGKSFQEGTLERVFAETLLGLIHKVLKEKEQQAIEDRSKWFQDEAMTGNNIQECGTFRRALSYRIEKEVVPIFAHIISIIDMNCNLDLITENNWKTELWLDLFICGDIVKVDSNQIKAKANKQSSSSMKCWFPFSNIVCEKISSMINAHRKTDLQSGLENVIRQTLKQTYYGQPLQMLPRGALNAYLRDVVFMEFEVNSVEHEIISTSVLAHIQYQKRSDPFMDIIDFHMVICDPLFRKRVDCFLTLTAAMPNVLGKIKDIVADARTALMDAIALRQCLYNLIPSECDELLDEQSRFIWCQNLHEIKLGTCHLLELFETYQDEFPERSSEIFTDIRLLWTRLQIMGMFVEHVCPPGIPSSRQDVTAALMLFDTLEDINDEMTSAASWQRLEDFLKQVADLTNHDELESCNDCIVCLEDLEDPVQLPCMHVVCHSCMQKWQLERETCPICQKKIPVEFKVSSDKTKRQISFKLGEFRRRCISFFMEVVSNFCFSSKQKSTIDAGVVELMISYVTTEKRETKEMSPFQDYGVDPTPTVRSFLIQQLLKMKDSKQVKEYLQKYLDDNSQETQYGIQSRLELCLLLIHCIEDMEMAALSAKGQDVQILIPILTKKLEKIRSRNESSSVTDISSLDVLADIRATLNKLADIVYGDVIENAWPTEDKEALKPKLSKVYSLFKDVCLRSSNENIQHYFLRQLLRLYGSNVMKEIIKYPVFEWLWPEESEKETSLEMDSFIIYGQQYKNMREKIAESALKEETQDLDSFWKDEDLPSSDVMNSAFVFLSIFREITNSSTKLSDEFCNSLKTFLMPKLVCPNLLKMLLEDGQSSEIELLNVTSSMNQREKGIAELVMHLLITLSLKNKDLLVQPLALLMLDPKSMANSYLPTMPDNPLSAVMEASQGSDPWITYQCPNGHAYVITE
eukprot:gene6457-7190_t